MALPGCAHWSALSCRVMSSVTWPLWPSASLTSCQTRRAPTAPRLRQRVASGVHDVRDALGACSVIESLVDRPHRCPGLFRERGVGHIEERAPPTRITPCHPPRINVDAVVAYRRIGQLLPLGHERDLPRR